MTIYNFLVFAAIATIAVLVDLFAQNAKTMTIGRAATWSAAWIALSLGYAGYLYKAVSPETAHLFLAGYLLEKVLSVDNLIVFIAVFKYFKIDGSGPLQHRILYFGVIGAVVFRAIFVGAGSLLLVAGPWADLLFGALVAFSAYKMLSGGDDDEGADKGAEQANNWLVRQARKLYPVVPRFVGEHFFVTAEEARAAGATDEELATGRAGGAGGAGETAKKAVRYMTPAFVCLLTIEASDLLFSFDSVPTVIAVTRKPLVIYAAMIFAVLGLRSLYFVLEALNRFLVHLEKAILGLLFFIAGKMFLHATNEILHWPGWDISPNQSLMVIVGALAIGVIASLFATREGKDA
jgi:tellurite resistance protein TerC